MKNFLVSLFFFAVTLGASLHAQTDTAKMPYINHFTSSFFEHQAFAHRGGYANGPENTLETILLNIEKQIKCMEIDIQLTKDNELVLFHDETISRVLNTDRDAKVSDLTLAELKQIPLRDTRLGKVYITSFRELADTLTQIIPRKKIDFLLELDWKPHGDYTNIAIDQLISIVEPKVKILGDSLYNYFFLSSFYPEVLKAVHAKAPKIKTGFAVHSNPDTHKLKAKLAILFAPYFIRKYHASIIEPNICMVTRRFVRKWHRKHILINTYTANTACEKEHILPLGIAYTTNCPEGTCTGDASEQPGKPKNWCKQCRKK